jgi:hypothetical protein
VPPSAPADPEAHHHYFVDEAGDLTLFDRRGRVIVGDEGVSRCFVVGAALVHDPAHLASQLEALRQDLLRDPYFASVPSMHPGAGKTALLFHAKDDVPEVRREVFRLLQGADVEVYAAFRRKRALAAELKAHFAATGEKLGADRVYDQLVTTVFTDRLHLAAQTHIVFARRGKADRNVALAGAIALAKAKFQRKGRKGIDRPVAVSSSTPSEVVCLQAVDYYLWALQRLLERGEGRYLAYLAPAFRLVVDRDDTRRHGYGEYYTASGNPLTPERLMPVT